MKNYRLILEKCGYTLKKKTSKSEVFNKGEEYIYYVDNINPVIVLNPEKVFNNTKLIDDNSGLLHNTSFNKFPKRKNEGLQKIHYGYKYNIESSTHLKELLSILDKKYKLSVNEIWNNLLEDILDDYQEIMLKIDSKEYRISLSINNEEELIVTSTLESLNIKLSVEDFEYYYPLFIEVKKSNDNTNKNRLN